MTLQTQITLIKGDGTFSPPKTRRILPTRALLWKYYLKTFIVWVIIIGALVLTILIFSFVSSFDNEFEFIHDPEVQFFIIIIAFIGSILIIPIVLLLLTFYVRNMEFVVHGDEIIVKKGLFNKTVKYCPFRTITNISTHVGVFDRLFQIGCINIQTAGGGGMASGPEEKMEGLLVYGEIREYIISQLRHFTHKPGNSSESSLKEINESFQTNILFELNEIKKEFLKIKESDLYE